MADRSLSAAMQAALASEKVPTFYLVEAEFDHGTVRATDAHQSITWDGKVWTRTYGLLGITGISETAALQVNKVTVSLSGVDTTLGMQAIMQDDFLDRPIRIFVGVFDSNFDVVIDPEKIFEGRMDSPTFTEDPGAGTAVISVNGTPAWADFGKRPGRHTNDEEQRSLFSGDVFFNLVSGIPKEIKWGRA